MASIFDIQTKSGKQKGILSIYIIHSLRKKPKSGYELIAEIKAKTEGAWIPSKGTIYPILKHLQEESLIKVKKVDKRSKHIFEVTDNGKKMLSSVKKHGKQMEEKMMKFRKLLGEVIGKGDSDIMNLIFDIRTKSFSTVKKKSEVIKTLEKCLLDLKRLTEVS